MEERNLIFSHHIFKLALFIVFPHPEKHLAWILYLPKHLKVINIIVNMRKFIVISKYQSYPNKHFTFLICLVQEIL